MVVSETARVLLFDSRNRLLLMKVDPESGVKDPGKPWLKSPFWVTPGGRLEQGEDVFSAAEREVSEEAGIDGVIGPVVWYGEQTLEINGQPTLLKETFVVARTNSDALSQEGWTSEERQAVKDLRWWSVDELEATSETILPPMITRLIRPVSEGQYVGQVINIDLSLQPAKT